jgi:hypothetical protein
MFRPLTPAVRRPRRGAILIVVLALLALFSVIALFFVFYADNEATLARLHRDTETTTGSAQAFPDNYSVETANSALAQIIFGIPDTGSDMLSAIRGHDLMATIYGRQWTGGNVYDGVGTFHENLNATSGLPPQFTDRALWVNYGVPVVVPPPAPNAGVYFLDPEYNGVRSAAQLGSPPQTLPGKTYIPKNAPYTYPDLNNLFLASLSPATGEVLVPSYHRPWLFNAANPNPALRMAPWNPADPSTAANTDWVTPEGRTKVLRPRPVDQLTPGEISAAIGSPTVPPGLTGLNAGQLAALRDAINSKIATGQVLPYPAANADGTYTADVQNLRGGVGVQKSDSILVDIGLPPKQWNGKWVKPLVAVLISDLDGLLNLNAHGNVRNLVTAPGVSKHTSYAGYGPHEVNLNSVLVGGEGDGVVFARYGSAGAAFGRNGLSVLAYDRSGVRVPQYAMVNWDGTGAAIPPPILFPSFPGNPFQVSPTFNNMPPQPPGAAAATPYYDDGTAQPPLPWKAQNHPLLFNPTDYGTPATGAPRTFPHSDLKRLNLKYAANRDWYQDTDLNRAGQVPASLIGTFPTGSGYRLDPAHTRRMFFTTLSTGLDRPGHVAAYNNITTGATALQLTQVTQPNPVPQALPFQPTWIGLPSVVPNPGAASGISDFSVPSYRNQRPVGPVDLNRPLTDYRTNTAAPLGQGAGADPTNSGNFLLAWADRHNLARDIFTRLVVATGANATIDPSMNPIVGAAPGTLEYNALRYLAQVAVNMVDAIDGDDVSTMFVWNPTNGAGGSNPLTPVDMSTVTTLATANTPETTNRIVFGTEKPRLVINEAYGELTNDTTTAFTPGQAAATPARVRFWVELMNPTNAPYPTGVTDGPLGDGSVTLYNGTTPSAYQVQIAQVDTTTANALKDPSNVKGDLPAPPPINFDFSTAQPNQRVVTPAAGNWAYASQPNGTRGFILVGASPVTSPHNGADSQPVEFNPTGPTPPYTAPYDQMILGTQPAPNSTTAMEYQYPGAAPPAVADLQNDAATNPLVALRRHVVVLRRLANPYQPPSVTNPFVTVDVMDWVPAFDAVARGGGAGDTNDRGPKAGPGITNAGYEPLGNVAGRRYSVGRVQPYAGFANGNPYAMNTLPSVMAFPNSMVIAQNPNPVPNPGQPLHTFFRNNGTQATSAPYTAATYTNGPPPSLTVSGNTETIMAPFDWLVHFDRSVVNPLELLHLQAGKPFELSQNFLRFDGMTGTNLRRDLGQVPWFGVNPTTGLPNPTYGPAGYAPTNSQTNNGLFRALDLLRVKPWMYGVGLGGRTFGQVNINTAQDPRVLQAVLDPMPAPWVPNTAYAVGQQVTNNNGSVYVCVSAGTSAASGGPNGNVIGAAIPDGGAGLVWNFARYASANTFNVFDVNNLWNQAINPPAPPPPGPAVPPFRTVNFKQVMMANGGTLNVPLAGPTIDDDPNGAFAPVRDRPVKALGVGEFAPTGPFGYTAGAGLQDTLLRVNPANGVPLVWSANANATHPYLQAEMARKMFNNVTTVSNAFAVSITVVFHEVRQDPAGPLSVDDKAYPPGVYTVAPTATATPTRFLIGREAYQDVPGDLRQQFYAVVDRSNAGLMPGGAMQQQPYYGALDQALSPAQPAPAAPPPGYDPPPAGSFNLYPADAVPIFNPAPGITPQPLPPPGLGTQSYTPTTIPPKAAYLLQVYADGQPITLGPGSVLFVGVGANQDVVTVNYVNQDGSLNVTGLAKPHGAGECVANILPGNPGVPGVTAGMPAFDRFTDPNSVKFRAVVPYASRIPRDQ